MYEPFVGTIQYFAFNFAPRGWSTCQGQTMQIQQNQALYALVGTYYGGNGTTNFMLPDLQGRSIVGFGQVAGLTPYIMGQKIGTENVAIPATALPAHTHTVGAVKIAANANDGDPGLSAAGNYPANIATGDGLYASAATSGVSLGAPTVTVAPAGGSQPVSLLSPYIALTCCIAITGFFPSRN